MEKENIFFINNLELLIIIFALCLHPCHISNLLDNYHCLLGQNDHDVKYLIAINWT